MCLDMVYRKTMMLMCMRSQHRLTLLYLPIMTLGKFVTIIGYIWWILWQFFCLENLLHWIHIFPQPSQHLLEKLVGSVGCYYKLCVGLYLMIGRWCYETDLCDNNSLHHGHCIVSSFPPLLAWGSVNNLPWCARYYFREGASYCGRRDQPW